MSLGTWQNKIPNALIQTNVMLQTLTNLNYKSQWLVKWVGLYAHECIKNSSLWNVFILLRKKKFNKKNSNTFLDLHRFCQPFPKRWFVSKNKYTRTQLFTKFLKTCKFWMLAAPSIGTNLNYVVEGCDWKIETFFGSRDSGFLQVPKLTETVLFISFLILMLAFLFWTYSEVIKTIILTIKFGKIVSFSV